MNPANYGQMCHSSAGGSRDILCGTSPNPSTHEDDDADDNVVVCRSCVSEPERDFESSVGELVASSSSCFANAVPGTSTPSYSVIQDQRNLSNKFCCHSSNLRIPLNNKKSDRIKRKLSAKYAKHVQKKVRRMARVLRTSESEPVFAHTVDDASTESSFNYTSVSSYNSDVDKMRRRLKFYFMNPIEKWHARDRFPWKLLVQIIKIIIVTIQLGLFAQQRYIYVTYLWNTKVTFSHLMVYGWDATREINVYPPGEGPLAIYTQSDFYKSLDFAVISYSKVPQDAIGLYRYVYFNDTSVLPKICTTQYKSGMADVDNNTYNINNDVVKNCIDIPTDKINDNWSTQDYFKARNFTVDFSILLRVQFRFYLKTIKLRVNLPYETPECYLLKGIINFDNRDHDGKMTVDLEIGAHILGCSGNIEITTEESSLKGLRSVINFTTLAVCLISLIMCVRAFFRAQSLCRSAEAFLYSHYQHRMTFEEKTRFINLWYVVICINDVLIIVGSVMKIGLETRKYESIIDTFNLCSVFLGLGNLLVWFGCLRYLGFFSTYNVLILTLRKCLPNVLRYSLCILMIFAGYALCGWLVLGPYNLKFNTFYSTMECLFSLINGDDMFATYSAVSGKSNLIWWFSRLYLYSFISLFIYVILSLFIAIIMDSYETIKHSYTPLPSVSVLDSFMAESQEEPSTGIYHDEGDQTMHDIVNALFCCCHRNRNGYSRI